MRPRLLFHFSRLVAALRTETSGSMVMFGLLLAALVLVFSGLAVDLMRVEAQRVRLQAAIDTAVLAAADVDQKRVPVEVVKDYLAKADVDQWIVGEPKYDKTDGRTVSVVTEMKMSPIFSKFTDELVIRAEGSASNSSPKAEVSLVLDISGSMADPAYDSLGNRTGKSRMQELQAATRRFVNTVLSADNRPNVTVSVVPFSEHVNAGAYILDQMNVRKFHNYSHCAEFPDSQFGTATLAKTDPLIQAPHFQWNYDDWYDSYDTVNNTICPRQSFAEILPLENDPSKVIAKVDSFVPRAGTAIHLGMKWGVALLDPSTNFLATKMYQDNKLAEGFKDRPRAYNANQVTKAIVLMTDGENSNSVRIGSPDDDPVNGYYSWNGTPMHSYWNRTNFGWYRNYYYAPAYYKYTKYSSNTLTQNICTAAKNKGIVIYGVGVSLTDDGKTVMRDCVTSPDHFFDVHGGGLERAFQNIATHFMALRLKR